MAAKADLDLGEREVRVLSCFCQCKILTKIEVGPRKQLGSKGVNSACSTWVAELDQQGGGVG